jgi:hypothetical protein
LISKELSRMDRIDKSTRTIKRSQNTEKTQLCERGCGIAVKDRNEHWNLTVCLQALKVEYQQMKSDLSESERSLKAINQIIITSGDISRSILHRLYDTENIISRKQIESILTELIKVLDGISENLNTLDSIDFLTKNLISSEEEGEDLI